MSDTLRHFLPPLRDEHRVPAITARGAWQALSVTDPLRVIGNGLNAAEKLRGRAEDIVSVPDVWAQVTVFHGALRETGHPLHRRAIGEWRGMIACFALAAHRAPDLTAEVITLSGLQDSRWAAIVQRLPPRSPLIDDKPMDQVGLVSIGGALVALAQPLTLLAPSRSLGDAGAPTTIPWLREGRFHDPLGSGVLSREEKLVLASFLDRLAADLEALDDKLEDRTMLVGMTRALREDLATPPAAPGELSSFPAGVQLPDARIFNAFRRLERAELAGAAPSDALLRLRAGLGGGLRGIVLFDPRLDQLMGRKASELRIWRTTTLQMLQANPGLLDRVREDAQAEGYLLVRSEELFLRKIYRARPVEEARPDGPVVQQGFTEHPSDLRQHLLPLSPLVLAVLAREDLKSNLRLTASVAAGTAVNLSLPLQAGGTITLSQLYPLDEAMEPPSALSVWPDLAVPAWRLHVGYTASVVRVQFAVGALLSDRGIARALDAEDGFRAVDAARSLLAGDATRCADTTWLSREGEVVRALHWLPGPVEAAILQDRRSGMQDTAGLLLLPPGKAPPGAAAREAVIGIDFGTTNTAAYLKVGRDAPVPLRIQPRQVTAYTAAPKDAEETRQELDREFLPTSTVDMPFQTILRTRRREGAEAGAAELWPLRDSLIYFAQQRSRAVSSAREGDSDLHSNLKWARDAGGNDRINLFLAQTAILGLAEAAARGVPPQAVSFRFSFPEAFRPWQKRGFQATSRAAVRTALRLVTGEAPPELKVTFQTESIATAQYFIHRRDVPATEGLITLDIGGGTTDVTILQAGEGGRSEVAWRGSFELAGRHMLIDHLCRDRTLLVRLGDLNAQLGELVKELGGTTRGPAEAPTESDILGTELVVNSPAFRQAVEEHLGRLTGIEAEQLRCVALTALAGLLDYVGRVAAHLAKEGRIAPRDATAISVCLGGRASLLFKALLEEDEEEKGRILGFLTAAAGGVLPRARLVFSTEPKEEVAFGLVRDDGFLGGAGRAGAEPLLGEALEAGTERAPADQRIAALDPALPWRIEEPAEFRRFLERLATLDIRLRRAPEVLVELVGGTNQDLSRAMAEAVRHRGEEGGAMDGESSAFEPPFIIMLRRLVRRLARDRTLLGPPA